MGCCFETCTGGVGGAWIDQVRRAEALGYVTTSIEDHLDSALAPIAALQAAAEATTTIRVGSCVFANDLRHPVLLAKEVASLDVLTEGRLEFGFGTGYARGDYTRTGIPFDPPGVRVARFAEAVQIIKAAFGGGPATFAGEYYDVHDLDLLPKPVQHPYPPLLIGVAASASWGWLRGRPTSLGSTSGRRWRAGSTGPASRPRRRTRKWRGSARRPGSSSAGSSCTRWLRSWPSPTTSAGAAAAMLTDWGVAGQVDADHLLASPHTLIGTEDELVAGLRARRERYGISYVTVFASAMDAFAPIVARLTGQ